MSTPPTDPNAFLDLDALHAAIVSDIKAQFPTLATVEFYRTEARRSVPCPAVLLDLCEFEAEPDDDPGTEQLAVSARFEAEIVFGFKTANVKQEIRKFAAAFAAWLRLRRWTGIVTDAAKVIGAYPDDFKPELDEYVVWRVEWSQVLYLGTNTWTDTSDLISLNTQVMVGTDPNIGPNHVADYVQIEINPGIIDPDVTQELEP
jgi:hypothetical protein